jgi:hypothetical protein
MPVISKEHAVERMTQQVEQFEADELLEVYNELFPKEPRTEAEVRADAVPLVKRINEYIGGRAIDELVELWSFIFPGRYRNIWYDEEAEGIHYDEADTVSVE